LKRAATHVLRPTLTVGLRLWRGVKTLDRSLQQSNCYAVCDEIVVKTVHGYKIIVDGHDTSLTPELVFGGHYKSREEEFYKKILHGGDWVIDAGAHVGSYCMLAAQRVGSFGRIFAYEPNPKAIRLLARSIIMNWMHDRMVLRPVAAREIAKTERLAFIPERLGDASEGPDEMINSIIHETSKMIGVAPTKIDVACVSLDQEFPIDLPIKILRIDAEGREVAVLKGARRLLKRGCVDFILIRIFRQVPWPYWRNKIARSRWSELLIELNRLTQSNYAPCTLEADGSLVKHESVLTAIDNLQSQHIVMMARDQYSSEG
jgi:FkbM family methyltransferase